MVVKDIELVNYVMFGVAGIKKLVYKPSSGKNIIIGGNGQGKSKLLYELSPLPVNKKHYKEGYKRITIEHKNNTYTLTSGNHIQSFKLGNEELNKNGLITTQTNLVEEHFGITNDIRALNLGLKRFTGLSVAERKKWFSTLSTTDYKFAISLYNNLKTNLRDIKGSIKLLNTKNITVDEGTLKALIVDRNYLTGVRDKLFVMSTDDIILEEDPDFSYLDEVDVLLNNLTSLIDNTPKASYIESKIIDIENTIVKLNKEVSDFVVEELDADLSKDIQNLQNEISKREETLHIVIRENIFKQLFDMRERISTYIECIKHTKKEYDEISMRYNNISETVFHLEEKQAILEENKTVLEGYRSKENVTCPKCTYSWKVGYNLKEYDLLLKNLSQVEKEAKEKRKILSELDISVKEARLSIEAREALYTFISPIHNEDVKLYIVNAIEEGIHSISILYLSVEASQEIYRLRTILEEKESVYKTQCVIKQNNQEHMLANKNKIEDILARTYDELTLSKKILKQTLLIEKQKEKLNAYIERVKNDIERFEHNSTVMLLSIKKELALETLEVVNAKLNIVVNSISKIENDMAILKFTQTKLEEERRRALVLESLISELSPDSGIIAESLSNFMFVFVEDMNEIINSIWRYEFKILPCSIDEGDLDYIFKVKIPNNTVDDIVELSTGQREIVDFAFKLTSFNYLGLLDMPITLDEVFINLEPEHKVLSFKYLDELIDSYTIEQAFMVSHQDESYTTIDENTIFLGDDIKSERLEIYK